MLAYILLIILAAVGRFLPHMIGGGFLKNESDTIISLDLWAEKQPRKVAMYAGDRSISYGDLHKKSSQLAGLLYRLGLSEQDRILIFMPNSIEYFIVFFAALKLNISLAPANPLSKSTELVQLIDTIEPRLAFVLDAAGEDLIHSVDSELPVISLSSENGSFWSTLDSQGCITAFPKDLKKAGVFLSTSGSTGKLKFVANTYQNELINARLYLQKLCITKDDILLTGLPVSQKFGLAAVLGGCISGCTVILSARFNAATMLSLIETYHVTVQYGVPTMYAKEIEAYSGATPKPDISSLRTGIIAGASGSADIFRWFEKTACCLLLNCYGTTEIGGLSMTEYHDPSSVRYNTCGRIFQGASVEIVDKGGQPLPPGKDGEILCTVPWAMREYAGNPELTKQMFDSSGRFLTGDIGRIDEAGNLIISGRKKDMIIRGGYNIFPAEVEIALLRDPNISEACVAGYPDACLGERICAFIKMRTGRSQNPEAIRDRLQQHIAAYKLPDRIIFMDQIPKLANGKSNYPALLSLLPRDTC